MRILMVGAGATGGFYGGLLARAGRDITFLLRDRRAAAIRTNGLQLQLHTGERLTLHPPVLTAADLPSQPPFDLIILSIKAYQLTQALDDIAPAVGPDTMLLPLLNGMAQLDLLSKRFGSPHVIGSTIRVAADLTPDGRIVQMNALDEWSYGELSGERTPRIEALDQTLRVPGYAAILQPDILATLWQKWWILASLGAICILARGTVGQAAASPYGAATNLAILAEATAIAAANGYPPVPAVLDEYRGRVTDPTFPMTTSLYRDLLKGAPLEADHILGDLLHHAQARSVAVPLLTAAFVQLKVQEAKLQEAAQG